MSDVWHRNGTTWIRDFNRPSSKRRAGNALEARYSCCGLNTNAIKRKKNWIVAVWSDHLLDAPLWIHRWRQLLIWVFCPIWTGQKSRNNISNLWARSARTKRRNCIENWRHKRSNVNWAKRTKISSIICIANTIIVRASVFSQAMCIGCGPRTHLMLHIPFFHCIFLVQDLNLCSIECILEIIRWSQIATLGHRKSNHIHIRMSAACQHIIHIYTHTNTLYTTNHVHV